MAGPLLMKRNGRQATRLPIRPPAPDTTEQIAALERQGGPLPLSLRAFYELVGSVNFVGTRPAHWNRLRKSVFDTMVERAAGQHGTRARSQDEEDVGLDPLYVAPLEDQLERYHYLGSPGDPFLLAIAPDHWHKLNISGLGNYDVEVPCPSADAPLLHEWHQTTFVNYLRICMRWAGLPGLARVGYPPQELAEVTAGLLPL
jgi:hypothetical protein